MYDINIVHISSMLEFLSLKDYMQIWQKLKNYPYNLHRQ